MKIGRNGLRAYVAHATTLFDGALVICGAVDLLMTLVFKLIFASDPSMRKVLHAMRLLKVLRILRLARLFNLFHGMQLIVQSYQRAFVNVMSIGMCLVIADYILAVFLTQLIGHTVEQWPEDKRQMITGFFGSIESSMVTLFVVMTLSHWTPSLLVVSEELPDWIVSFGYMIYIMVASYSFVSLITSVLQSEMAKVRRHDELCRIEAYYEEHQFVHDQIESWLTKVATRMDADGNGRLSRSEAKTFIESHPHALDKLATLGIRITVEEWLHIMDAMVSKAEDESHIQLDHDSKDFPIEDIVHMVMHVQGDAKASHTSLLKHDILDLHMRIKIVEGEVMEARHAQQEAYDEHPVDMCRVLGDLDLFEEAAAALESKMDHTFSATMQQLDSIILLIDGDVHTDCIMEGSSLRDLRYLAHQRFESPTWTPNSSFS